MKIFISFIFTCFFSIVASSALVTVGEKTISLEEFRDKFQQTQSAVNPPKAEQFLEDLIRYEIAIQEARKKKLENHPFLKERMNQELYKVLLETELGDKLADIKISNSEVRREYQRHPEIRTSHIFFELPAKASPKQTASVKKRAQTILEKVLKSKKPFEQLAMLYSDDALTKVLGGDLGFQTRLSANASYYTAAVKLKKGQIHKKLVSTPYGFHIIKLTGKKAFKKADQRQIRSLVFERKKQALFNQYFSRLKRRYKISVNPKERKQLRSL